MPDRDEYLTLDADALLAQCDVHLYRASGPGGQHRNKVSSAVRLRHRPTGVAATAADSRSQHENKRMALRRLRMNIACGVRRSVDLAAVEVPAVVSECIRRPRGKADAGHRIEVGAKDARFWAVAAFLLDLLEAAEGRVGSAARAAGVTTGSVGAVLAAERHLMGAAQQIRRRHGLKPLS